MLRQTQQRHTETLAIVQTYADLIAYWLRFVESFAVAQRRSTDIDKSCSETMNLIDGLSQTQLMQWFEPLNLGSTVLRQSRINPIESVQLATANGNLVAFDRRFDEALALADFRQTHVDKVLFRVLTIASLLFNDLGKAVHSEVHVSDSYQSDLQRLVFEAFKVGAVFGRGISLPLSDQFAFGSSLGQSLTKQLTETLGWAINYTDLIAFVVSVSERLALRDVSASEIAKEVGEQFALNDDTAVSIVKLVMEMVALSEAYGTESIKELPEHLTVQEAYSGVAGFARAFAESIEVSSALGRHDTKVLMQSFLLQRTFSLHSSKVFAQVFAFLCTNQRDATKQSLESWAIHDGHQLDVLLRVAQSFALLETYTDLIAFVLSVSESMRFDERRTNATQKRADEALGASDKVDKDFIKDIRVDLVVLEDLVRDLRQALRETFAFDRAQVNETIKGISDAMAVLDDLRRDSTMVASEAFGLAQVLSRSFLQPLIEAISLRSSATRAPSKAARESLNMTDHQHRVFVSQWSSDLGVDGRLGQQAIKAVEDAILVALSLSKDATKVNAEQWHSSDAMKRQSLKPFSEALAWADAYADLIDWMLGITEQITLADALQRSLDKRLEESIDVSEVLGKSVTKPLQDAFALAELTGRAVTYRRLISEGFAVSEALRRVQSVSLHEALDTAEQYRRHANGVVSDLIISSLELTEQDFMDVVQAGHAPGYSDFRDFIAGDYTYAKAMFRAVLHSTNADRGYIKSLRLNVDVPDVLDRGSATVTDAASGVNVSFVRRFRAPPEVTLTHKSGTVMAIARLVGSSTTNGFSAVLENSSGDRVVGTFSWIAQGY